MDILGKHMIEVLESRIKDASQKYYSSGTSPYSDAEFDSMVEQLRELKPDSSVLHKTGHGYDVNSSSTPGEKFKHKYQQAGSLTKAYEWKEVESFLKNQSVELSLKLDGLSMVLYYKEGVLTNAVTRGDGFTGIDVTNKILCVIPPEIKDKSFTGAVRGEILMTNSNWEEYHQLHPEAKNSRNSTAGIINSKGVPEDMKYLTLVVYTVVGIEPSTETRYNWFLNDLNQIHVWLGHNFDNVVPALYVNIFTNSKSMKDVRESFCERCDYPNDGIVIKLRKPEYNPLHNAVYYAAQAYKFEAEKAVTAVTDIEWNLSKTRYLIPKARLCTVNISGTNVSYATCFNAEYVKSSGIAPGASVEVEKHGEIIPCINKVITPGKYELPKKCPSCGSDLIWNGVHLQCPNEECTNAERQDIISWLKFLAPVEGFGSLLQMKFLDQCLEDDKMTVEGIMEQGFDIVYCTGGGAQYQKFVEMCEALYKGQFDLTDALMALNIPRLGDKTSELLSRYPELVKNIIDSYEDRQDVDGALYVDLIHAIGDANASSIFHNLKKFSRLNLIKDRIIWDTDKSNVEYKGKVAVTGKLSVPRKQFEAELNSHGWQLGDVVKGIAYLITDDPTSSSSKNLKADKLDIQKVTEADFRNSFMGD